MRRRFAVVLLLLTSSLGAGAEEPTPVNPPLPEPVAPMQKTQPAGVPRNQDYFIDIHRLSSAPAIDGKLDDPVWQEGNLLDNFIQLEPDHGQPSTQKTEVRMGYDAKAEALDVEESLAG